MARSVLYDKNRVESGTVLIETVLSGNRGYLVPSIIQILDFLFAPETLKKFHLVWIRILLFLI